MSKEKITIVGAGLCGALLALRMAQRGYKIQLFERRSDMRLKEVDAGRSINLALSNRGIKALELVGLKDYIQEYCIPMHGRMIHSVKGEESFSRYSGRQGEFINSVSRAELNMALLDKADKNEEVELIFDHKCIDLDLKSGKTKFLNTRTNNIIEVEADLVFGTDGAGSAVRRSMMGRTTQLLFNYQQDFLRHGYKELEIPAAEDGSCRIEKNALHIWPRGEYMVIALPNLDNSFTVTMFHPYKGAAGFDTLDTKEKVMSFFEAEYPDILPHMPNFIEDYFDNPTGTLGTIKCYPWQAYGKVCLLGDAAHAIVPFYGQGMNASFEDVSIFDEMMDQHDGDWTSTFNKFQDSRKPNADAIAELAIDNFHEMKDHVDDKAFMKKRKLEMQLEKEFPDYYSKYSLVTFREELPYALAKKMGRAQDRFLLELCEKGEDENLSLDEVFEKVKALHS